MVEEFVESRGWKDLPQFSYLGWSKQRLAKAAISEVLNQMMSFMNPSELTDGRVTIDIDPHEENQLAKDRWGFLRGPMVNIDLGQSVSVRPQVVRQLVQMVGFIYLGQTDEAVEVSRRYMDYKNENEVAEFKARLNSNSKLNNDPFEVLTKTFEDVELNGISLKPEFLYFQKLFATLVGLKRHTGDPHYLMKVAKKIVALRAIAHPGLVLREVRKGRTLFQSLQAGAPVVVAPLFLKGPVRCQDIHLVMAR